MDTIKRLKTRAEAWQKATGLRDAFNGSVAILNVYTLHYSDVILMKFAEKDRNKIPYLQTCRLFRIVHIEKHVI